MEVLERGVGPEPPYSIRQMGIYLVVDTEAGLVLLWDRKTSIFLKLSPEFKVGPRPPPGGPALAPDRARRQDRRGEEGVSRQEALRCLSRVLWLPGHPHKRVAASRVLDPGSPIQLFRGPLPPGVLGKDPTCLLQLLGPQATVQPRVTVLTAVCAHMSSGSQAPGRQATPTQDTLISAGPHQQGPYFHMRPRSWVPSQGPCWSLGNTTQPTVLPLLLPLSSGRGTTMAPWAEWGRTR